MNIIEHYRRSNANSHRNLPLEQARIVDSHWGDVTAEPGGVDYLEVDAGGVRALWAVPHGAPDDGVLLCVHGGGFIGGSMYTHRKMFAHLAKRAGVRALIVDYRLTPEFRHPAALEDCVTAYEWLRAQGVTRIAITGDSAGGLLTLTTTLRVDPKPVAIMPFSAWTDMEFRGESLKANVSTDVLFGGDRPMNLRALVGMYVGPDGDPADPEASPINADLSGLPPAYITVSDAEMLLDDSVRLHEKAVSQGVDATLDVVPGQQHTFQMAAGHDEVADDSLARMAAWVRPFLV
ncbi:alpha/beta hydrolase [Actinophytocola sp. NPDC049390]|uniref:alpha/beta hydrolase n=1 Tax=Actinophytocola sp. NPDC049390 TaxID=3363894 RepID=UPI00379F134E